MFIFTKNVCFSFLIFYFSMPYFPSSSVTVVSSYPSIVTRTLLGWTSRIWAVPGKFSNVSPLLNILVFPFGSFNIALRPPPSAIVARNFALIGGISGFFSSGGDTTTSKTGAWSGVSQTAENADKEGSGSLLSDERTGFQEEGRAENETVSIGIGQKRLKRTIPPAM